MRTGSLIVEATSWGCSPTTNSFGCQCRLCWKATRLIMMTTLFLECKARLDGLSIPLPLRMSIFLRDPGLLLSYLPAHQPFPLGLLPVAVLPSDSTIILGSSGPEAMEVSSGGNGASSSLGKQFTVPSPTVEVTVSTLSTNFHVSSASTVVVNSTGHSSLPQLSYGDIKEHLPSAGTPDFPNVPTVPSTTYAPLKVAQLMLGLPSTTVGFSKMTPTSSMPVGAPMVNKEKPLSTKSFTLGANAFGNLGTLEQ